jgi:hypothetical protein
MVTIASGKCANMMTMPQRKQRTQLKRTGTRRLPQQPGFLSK